MATENSASQRANAIKTHSNLEWYEVDASVVDVQARKLLTDYANIPADQINRRISATREKAFEIFPYPCIGMYRFLDLSLPSQSYYADILVRIKNGEQFLDIGCGFGQELRQLVFDGAPAENLFAADLRPEFIELGFELFGDKTTTGVTYLSVNVFNDDSPLARLYGRISIVYAGSFFHLFDWAQQFEVAKRIVKLLKPEKGSTLIGRQVANINAGDYFDAGYEGEKPRYRHNEKSWSDFWDEVGEATNTKWRSESTLVEYGGRRSGDATDSVDNMEKKLTDKRREDGARRMRFVVTRL